MNTFKYQLLSLLTSLLIFNCTTALASANTIVDKNPTKVATIEKLIRQHIALGRLKNTFFHPIIANKKSRPTRNPFIDMPKKTADALTKRGINLSALSRYKAIYFKGEYLGAQSRKIINTSPNTVLVVGKGTRLHDPIYSRGPVIVFGQPDDFAGVFSSNVVWFNTQSKGVIPSHNTFIGMPIVNGRINPTIRTVTQGEINLIKWRRQQECKRYTNNAIKQNADNRSLACGFKGPRWSNNWKGQNDWCMTVLEPFSNIESSARADSLASCQAKKTSAENPKNRPIIPAQCNDPSKQYGAVKKINHSFRYEQKPTSPIQNGLIRYDYNQDKRHDYVFLEAKGENSRVVICLSQGANYQRRVTDIKINSSRGGLGSYDYNITQNGATLNVDVYYFEHNAGSSASKASYRYQPTTRKFKVIKSDSSANGIEQDGFTYPISSPPIHSLF